MALRYKSQLSQLRNDIASLKAATPTAQLVQYDAEDCIGENLSYAGALAAEQVMIPRELEFHQWVDFVNRELRG
jgi:hypothetical protein